MSTIYFVRHGQASFGGVDYDRLSERGEEQALALAEHFVALQKNFDAVYTGTLNRQKDTAACLLDVYEKNGSDRLPLTTRREFNEFDFMPLLTCHAKQCRESIDWKALSENAKAFQKFYERAMYCWIAGELADGIEPWPVFTERVEDGFVRLIRENGRGKALLVVTSAGVISAILRRILHLGDEAALRLSWAIFNTSVTTVLYNDDDVSLSSFNSIAHLEQPGRQALVTYR